MAEPKFLLREPKATGRTLIFLIYRTGNKRLKYSTGESIEPKYWDAKLQRPIQSDQEGNPLTGKLKKRLKDINIQLERYVDAVETVISYWDKHKLEPGIKTLRESLDEVFIKQDQEPEENKTDMLAWIENYIDNVKYTTNTKPIRPISELTKKKYRATLTHLQNFAKSKRFGKLGFDDIDMDFYEDFLSYLQDDLQQTTNTIGKYIFTLKMFMDRATEAHINTNLAYRDKKFAGMKEDVEHIYLSENEMTRLYKLDLSNNKRLEKIRDVFIIGARIAQRFGDYTDIKPGNIITDDDGTMYVKLRQQKGHGERVTIPLHWQAVEMIKKYDFKLPDPISSQKSNTYLKELGKLAGIDSPVQIDKTKAGKRVSESYKKYQLISTHTARRTGASLLYRAGIPAISIMQLTGHKRESTFLRYICLSKDEHARLMAQNPYFKKRGEISEPD